MEEGENTQKKKGIMSMPMMAGIAAVVMVVIVGGFLFLKPQTSDQVESPSIDITQPVNGTESSSGTDEIVDATETGEVVFEISGKPFEFDVTDMNVKVGDTVRVVFTSESGTHNWTVDEFGAATETVGSGSSSEVTFVADQAGTFEYFCSVGSHRQLGMVGILTVTE